MSFRLNFKNGVFLVESNPQAINDSILFRNLIEDFPEEKEFDIEIDSEILLEDAEELFSYYDDRFNLDKFTHHRRVSQLVHFLQIEKLYSYLQHYDFELFKRERKETRLENDVRQSYLNGIPPRRNITVPAFFPHKEKKELSGMPIYQDTIIGSYEREKFKRDLNEIFQSPYPGFWNNIILAGGAVVRLIGDFLPGDLDFFLYGLNEEEANEKIKQILIGYSETYRVAIRTKNTLNIYFADLPKVSIILRLYKDPMEVLSGFDIDPARCYYDGSDVRMFPSCARSFEYGYSLINGNNQTFRTNSFEYRIKKYSNLGFNARIPGFVPDDVRGEIYLEKEENLHGLAKLLKKFSQNNIEEDETSYDLNIKAFSQLQWHPEDLEEQLYSDYDRSYIFVFNDLGNILSLLDAEVWYDDELHHHGGARLSGIPAIPQRIEYIGSLKEYLKSLPPVDNWFDGVYHNDVLIF